MRAFVYVACTAGWLRLLPQELRCLLFRRHHIATASQQQQRFCCCLKELCSCRKYTKPPPSLSLSPCLPASLPPISSHSTTGGFLSCIQFSGQAVSGTCSSFLKKEKFKKGRWPDVFTGVSEQLVHRGHQARDLDLELEASGSVWIFLAKGMSLMLLWLAGVLFPLFILRHFFSFLISLGVWKHSWLQAWRFKNIQACLKTSCKEIKMLMIRKTALYLKCLGWI